MNGFPYGPLIALQGAGKIYGRNLRDLSYEIGSYFDSISKWYYRHNSESYVEQFTKRQTEIGDYLIENKIKPKIAPMISRGLEGFYKSTIDKLSYELKKNLLSLYDMKNLRKQMEKFATSKDDLSTTLFFKLTDPFSEENKVFSIQITKDDLIDMGFIEWGYSKTPKGYGLEQNEISINKVVT